MIKVFRVQNYKALRDVELKLTPIHVLIGPNDSGKTSILEAIGALCRSVDMPLVEAFLGAWEGLQLVHGGDEMDPVSFWTEIIEGPFSFSYSLRCKFSPGGRSVSVDGEYFKMEGASTYEDFGASGSVTKVFDKRNAPRSRNSSPGPIELIRGALSGVEVYRWDAQFLSLPVALSGKQTFSMQSTGFGLALFLDEMLGYDRDRFSNLERQFREYFPEVRSIKIVSQQGFTNTVSGERGAQFLQPAPGKGLCFELAHVSKLVPASQMSDGVLLILAYLAVLYSPKPPRILLIEEPENGIHPARLKDVLNILRKLIAQQSYTQVVMTTHSPYVVDQFDAAEVSVCTRRDDGTVSINRLSDSETVREQLKLFSLGEIWTAEGDEVLAGRAALKAENGQ